MPPMPAVPERGPILPPEQRRAIEQDHRWWRGFLRERGW